MLHYPKIPSSRHAPDGRCIAFEKYDGSNLHWEWDRDFGWHSFGPRRDEFNLTEAGIDEFRRQHAHLRECVEVFQATLAGGIDRVFREHPDYQACSAFKVFTEFFGPNSFAGLHKENDPKELRLFDVWAEPLGMIGPKRFVADFGHLNVARVVYEGKLTGKFTEDVWMVKVKAYAYRERLKQAFADRWEDYWE